MIEDLLNDLASSGWTISWAFQFAPDHWRVSIIHHSDIGEPSGTYLSHCADAPTFHDALEDAMCRRNDAIFTPTTEPTGIIEKPPTLSDLLKALPSHKPRPIDRRI